MQNSNQTLIASNSPESPPRASLCMPCGSTAIGPEGGAQLSEHVPPVTTKACYYSRITLHATTLVLLLKLFIPSQTQVYTHTHTHMQGACSVHGG